jgi:hypothetical protein
MHVGVSETGTGRRLKSGAWSSEHFSLHTASALTVSLDQAPLVALFTASNNCS